MAKEPRNSKFVTSAVDYASSCIEAAMSRIFPGGYSLQIHTSAFKFIHYLVFIFILHFTPSFLASFGAATINIFVSEMFTAAFHFLAG